MEKTTKSDLALETKSAVAESASAEKAADESTEEVPKSLETKISEALVAKDEPQVCALIAEAPKTELAHIGTNSTLMTDLMKLLLSASLEESILHPCLDLLYAHVDDVDALKESIKVRFGVDLIDSGDVGSSTLRDKDAVDEFTNGETLEDWGPNGAIGVYRSLLLLPPSHWAQINGITTQDISNGAGGYAIPYYKCLNVDYDELNTDVLVEDMYCDEGDTQYDLRLLDTTVVHEIGHVIDESKDPPYSADPDFQKISGWKFEGNRPNELADVIEGYAGSKAYADTDMPLNADEKAVAKEGAILLLGNENADVNDCIAKPYNDAISDGKAASLRPYREMKNACLSGKLYQHIMRSWPSKDPWMKGLQSDMSRQIHKPYDWKGWYSFDNAAFNDKISRYQLRDPGEEFAEAYATYHVGGPDKVPKHKDWIEKHNLHKDPSN
ncbi:MAG: hypothetical protein FWC40_00835 [Proteobacteria bacterium]|nr:hypothetical protein [Pseudomonadota bacterium]